ncbi:MAG: hypothetical protein ABSG97_03470 [Sedimentisphaerales bacterium]
MPPAKGDFDDTFLPVPVKRKKEVFLPPSGCYYRTEAEKQERCFFNYANPIRKNPPDGYLFDSGVGINQLMISEAGPAIRYVSDCRLSPAFVKTMAGKILGLCF